MKIGFIGFGKFAELRKNTDKLEGITFTGYHDLKKGRFKS